MFGKKKKEPKSHKLITGVIVGGAVGSVLSLYARKKYQEREGEEGERAFEKDTLRELESAQPAEKVVAEKATRPLLRILKIFFKVISFVFLGIWRLLAQVGRRAARQEESEI